MRFRSRVSATDSLFRRRACDLRSTSFPAYIDVRPTPRREAVGRTPVGQRRDAFFLEQQRAISSTEKRPNRGYLKRPTNGL